MDQNELAAVWRMRKALSSGTVQEITETIIDNLMLTKNNKEFVDIIDKTAF